MKGQMIGRQLGNAAEVEASETVRRMFDKLRIPEYMDAFTAICNGKTDFWLNSKFDPLKVHYIDHDVVKKYPVDKFLRTTKQYTKMIHYELILTEDKSEDSESEDSESEDSESEDNESESDE